MNRIDELFRDKTADFKPAGGAPSWEQFQAHKAAAGSKKPKATYWWGIAAGLALVLIAGWWLLQGNPAQQEIARQQEEPAISSPQQEAPALAQTSAPEPEQAPAAATETTAQAEEALFAKAEKEIPANKRLQQAPVQDVNTTLVAQNAVAQTTGPQETEESITASEPILIQTVSLSSKSAKLSLASNQAALHAIAIEAVAVPDSTVIQEEKGLLARLKALDLGDIREAKNELFAKATAIEVSNPLKNSK